MSREIDQLRLQVSSLEEQLDSVLPIATVGELRDQERKYAHLNAHNQRSW